MSKISLFASLRRFKQCQSGATAVEYGLIASLIVVAILAALREFGDANEATYNSVENAIISST